MKQINTKQNIEHNPQRKLRLLIKEEIHKILKEEEGNFKIEPNFAFKLYDILAKDFKDLQTKYPTKSSFFYYLNNKL